jgi:hypothetical protein
MEIAAAVVPAEKAHECERQSVEEHNHRKIILSAARGEYGTAAGLLS